MGRRPDWLRLPMVLACLLGTATNVCAARADEDNPSGCGQSGIQSLRNSNGKNGSSHPEQTLTQCKDAYRRFFENHTACLAPSTSATQEGIAPYLREYVVKLHNDYRGRVGEEAWLRQPTATNMQRMYWDDELAHIAQKWAGQCQFHHEDAAGRYIPGYYAVGQNLAKGHFTWSSVVRHWYSEAANLSFGVGQRFPRATVGHYTQLVWAESARVGCGYARCNATSTPLYVCNYGPTGNYPSRKFAPYSAGKKGSACPAKFRDGLCDCSGKVCKNKGVLNVATCQCTCAQLKWIVGDDCSLNCDAATDSLMCSTKGGHLTEDDCRMYEDVAYELCPVMCGLCEAKGEAPMKQEEEDCSRPKSAISVSVDEHKPKVAKPDKDSKIAQLMSLLGIEPDKQPSKTWEKPEKQANTAKVKTEIGSESDKAATKKVADKQEIESKLKWIKAKLGIEPESSEQEINSEKPARGATTSTVATRKDQPDGAGGHHAATSKQQEQHPKPATVSKASKALNIPSDSWDDFLYG